MITTAVSHWPQIGIFASPCTAGNGERLGRLCFLSPAGAALHKDDIKPAVIAITAVLYTRPWFAVGS